MVATNVDAKVNVPLTLPSIYSTSYFPNDVSTVIAYLAKPVPVASGAWSTGTTAGSLIFNQRSWLGVYANTMWMNKLRGFYGLRASLRVDLILNATPFHQGRLRLCYYPCASINSIKANMHNGHRIPLSQLPGVDIGTGDVSVSLSIPYVAPGRFIELTSSGNVFDWGDIYVAVMSGLAVGASGDSTVDYTIWYSMHDVELFGQTYLPVQQSQVGKGRAKRIMPAEHEERPISYVLGAAANFAGSIAKIPLLTPWAGPVSWFLNAAKGAAYSFGLAKPMISDKPCMMSANYHWYTTSSDGIDNSVPLSLLYDAKLKLLDDVSDGAQDQMSIEFIKRQWSYYTSINLNEADTLGLQVARIDLYPTLFNVSSGTNSVYYTPVAYLARLFGLYRGGFEIMLKFVKTGFHTGSIACTFMPGPHDNTISFTDTSYAYRTVLDLQEGDHACFRCPYLLPLDYINVTIPSGGFYIHVVNPLRSPETCASSIEILIYVRGADSLQYQKPISPDVVPVTQQGGEITKISEDIVCEAPGDAPVAPLNLEFCQDSMSECAMSLLQLIKRYTNISFEYTDPGHNSVQLIPWGVGCGRYNGGIYTPPRQIYDPLLALIMAPFAFYRGGARVRVTPAVSGTENVGPYIYRIDGDGVDGLAYAVSSAQAYYSTEYTIGSLRTQTLPPAYNTFGSGGLSVQVPYQNVYRMTPIQYAHLSSSTANFFTPRARISIVTNDNRDRLVSRAMADDFQCLFWVGIPRLNA